MRTKEDIARNAASTWCRCFKCDGIVNTTHDKCEKDKLLTCHKWYDGYRTALLAISNDKMQPSQYLRFGDIPDGEKSKVRKGEECIGEEEGVSVYNVMTDESGNISVCISMPFRRNTLDTFRMLTEYSGRPCYLVEGTFIGTGRDGEPLIKDVKIIKQVEYINKQK